MEKKLVLSIEDISKEYEIKAEKLKTLKKWLTHLIKDPYYLFRTNRPLFLALDNISFKVYEGEIIGLIGANGSGKSTLLKILSQITSPTSGSVKIWGRVAALIEVGTGFHKELSGRENIFINGAIIGMKRAEIKSKFDQIVSFSGIDKRLIDIPIKKYSSGMKIRLAFSIIAHLSTDLLLMDEVLAVSDVAFQQKGLKKLKELAKQGKTIVYVSHDLGSVAKICDRCILLEKGKVIYKGGVEQTIAQYLSQANPLQKAGSLKISNLGLLQFFDCTILPYNQNRQEIVVGDALVIYFKCQIDPSQVGKMAKINLELSIKEDQQNRQLFSSQYALSLLDKGVLHHTKDIQCITAPLNLVRGNYSLSLSVRAKRINRNIVDFAKFSIQSTRQSVEMKTGNLLVVPTKWTIKELVNVE